ncbi:basic proline-rich protein-like [Strigops habroptila]|uniref:basic proline-rich protein-like n=1 Tax=Strigops habroptila TaxID=2489341 RepID=UPI0011CF0AE8|nr:basic proline-rich protein-like [Strigops habroptila]
MSPTISAQVKQQMTAAALPHHQHSGCASPSWLSIALPGGSSPAPGAEPLGPLARGEQQRSGLPESSLPLMRPQPRVARAEAGAEEGAEGSRQPGAPRAAAGGRGSTRGEQNPQPVGGAPARPFLPHRPSLTPRAARLPGQEPRQGPHTRAPYPPAAGPHGEAAVLPRPCPSAPGPVPAAPRRRPGRSIRLRLTRAPASSRHVTPAGGSPRAPPPRPRPRPVPSPGGSACGTGARPDPPGQRQRCGEGSALPGRGTGRGRAAPALRAGRWLQVPPVPQRIPQAAAAARLSHQPRYNGSPCAPAPPRTPPLPVTQLSQFPRAHQIPSSPVHTGRSSPAAPRLPGAHRLPRLPGPQRTPLPAAGGLAHAQRSGAVRSAPRGAGTRRDPPLPSRGTPGKDRSPGLSSHSTPDRQPLGPALRKYGPACPCPPRSPPGLGRDGTARCGSLPPARSPPPCQPAPRVLLPHRCSTCPRSPGVRGLSPCRQPPPRSGPGFCRRSCHNDSTEPDAAISPLLSSPLPVCGQPCTPSEPHLYCSHQPWTGDPIPGLDPSPAVLRGIKLQITAGNRHCKKIHLAKEQGPVKESHIPGPTFPGTSPRFPGKQ